MGSDNFPFAPIPKPAPPSLVESISRQLSEAGAPTPAAAGSCSSVSTRRGRRFS